MKKPLLLGLALAVALVGLALWLPSLRARLAAPPRAPEPGPGEERGPAPLPPSSLAAKTPAPSAPGKTAAADPIPPTTLPGEAASPKRPLKALGHARQDAQVRKVVESMDLTDRPPAGVAQGGRKGKDRGVFQNLERRLPARPAGYYRESDLWPRGASGRGPERLVFGREGEVYYSKDHYRSFLRLR